MKVLLTLLWMAGVVFAAVVVVVGVLVWFVLGLLNAAAGP